MIKLLPPSALSRGYLVALCLAAWAAMALTLLVLRPLFTGGGWWWACLMATLIVFAASAAIWCVRASPLMTLAAQLAVALGVLTVFSGGGTGLFGVIPLGATFDRFGELAAAATRTIAEQAAPIHVVDSIQFLLLVATIAVAMLAFHTLIWLRWTPLTALVIVVPVIIPPLVLPTPDAWHLVLVGAALLVIFRIDVLARRHAETVKTGQPRVIRRANTRPMVRVATTVRTIGTAGVAIAITALVGSSLPLIEPVRAAGTPAVILDGTTVSPYLDLGRDLRRPNPVTLFTYTSPNGSAPYFRMLVVDDFNGQGWKATEGRFDVRNSVQAMSFPIGLSTDIVAKREQVEVTIRALNTRWLPVPFPAAGTQGVRGSWAYDEANRTIRSTQPGTLGQRYKVDFYDLEPKPEQLRSGIVIDRTDLQQFLALPPDPGLDSIVGTMSQVVGNARTPYDQAVALQAWFRGGAFTYSESTPAQAGYDGSGIGVIARFLQEKSGYCIHFASAMAVMARAMGIPSRVAIGYLPGVLTDRSENGQRVAEVTSRDLHAWPELYFDGVGWVAFEPTPGRGSVPAYTLGDVPVATAGPTATAAAPSPTATATSGRPNDIDPSTAPRASTGSPLWVQWVITGAVIALIACLPLLMRIGVRARRRQGCLRGDRPASDAWRELCGAALDHRIALPRQASPANTARALAAELRLDHEASASLALLQQAIEREWFAAPTGPPNAGERAALWAAVRALGRVMSARYTVGQQVLDAMLPSSMPRQLAAAFMRRRSQ